MDLRKTYDCFICSKPNLLNLRSHIRYAHDMTISEARQQYSGSPASSSRPTSVTENGITSGVPKKTKFGDLMTTESDDESSLHKSDQNLMKGKPHPKDFLSELQAFAEMRTCKKRSYIKHHAKPKFITFLREVICNVLKKNILVNIDQLKTCKCNRELTKVIDNRKSHSQVRKYLSCQGMLTFLGFIIHPAIEYLSMSRPLLITQETRNPLDIFG